MRYIDRITLAGDGILAQEAACLALARDLRGLLAEVIRVLDADPNLFKAVEMPKAEDSQTSLT